MAIAMCSILNMHVEFELIKSGIIWTNFFKRCSDVSFYCYGMKYIIT